MDITLFNFMNEQLSLVSLDFKRYMYEKLPWEARLVGLMGPRGVGKSTMILQRIKEMAEADQQTYSLHIGRSQLFHHPYLCGYS